jgi:hypothetical protein
MALHFQRGRKALRPYGILDCCKNPFFKRPDTPYFAPPTPAPFWREFEGRSRPSMGGTGG